NYTVTLTLTNEAGKTSVTTQNITITAENRKVIYVSNNGSDTNNGLSPTAAVKTWDKARSLVADNTEILFERGGTYDVKSTMQIAKTNVVIGSYGTGAKPVLD